MVTPSDGIILPWYLRVMTLVPAIIHTDVAFTQVSNKGGALLDKLRYKIHVEGRLGTVWQTWFEGLSIRYTENGNTILSGSMDQSMLRGVLMKICDLGVVLVDVHKIDYSRPIKDAEI
jgi:hypothetical protein